MKRPNRKVPAVEDLVVIWLNPDQLKILKAITRKLFTDQATVNDTVNLAVKLVCAHPEILRQWFRQNFAYFDAEGVTDGNMKMRMLDDWVARAAVAPA